MIKLVLSVIALAVSITALLYTSRKLRKLERHLAQLDLDVTMLVQNNNSIDN